MSKKAIIKKIENTLLFFMFKIVCKVYMVHIEVLMILNFKLKKNAMVYLIKLYIRILNELYVLKLLFGLL